MGLGQKLVEQKLEGGGESWRDWGEHREKEMKRSSKKKKKDWLEEAKSVKGQQRMLGYRTEKER